MDHLGLAAVLDGHSRGSQAGSVQIAFVAQRIVLGGDDDGRRQAAEAGGVQGADSGICPQGRIGDPQPRAPGDIVSGQAPAGRLLGDAGLGQGQVGVREGQDLGFGQGVAFVTQLQASQRGQVPAGAVTCDDEGAISPGQLRLVIEGPPDGAALG